MTPISTSYCNYECGGFNKEYCGGFYYNFVNMYASDPSKFSWIWNHTAKVTVIDYFSEQENY